MTSWIVYHLVNLALVAGLAEDGESTWWEDFSDQFWFYTFATLAVWPCHHSSPSLRWPPPVDPAAVAPATSAGCSEDRGDVQGSRSIRLCMIR